MKDFLADFFASIYENTWFGIYQNNFALIFKHLFDNGGYIKIGLTFILIPFFILLIFYYLFKNPYVKQLHWILLIISISLVVFIVTYLIVDNEILSSSNKALNKALSLDSTGYKKYASTLGAEYGLINAFLALLISVFYSLIMRPFSKIQMHLPF